MRRFFAAMSFVVAGISGTAAVGLMNEEDFPLNEVAVPLFLSLLFAGVGFQLLRGVERPVFGDGRVTRFVSALFLVLAAVMATIFIGVVFSGDAAGRNDGAIPLFLSLLLGGSGLSLRGTRTSGSFVGKITLFGMAAVAVPLLLLLFVFASATDEDQVIADDGQLIMVDIDSGSVPIEVVVTTVLLMIFGAGAVWFWSRRAVAPMAEITHVANEIQGGSLDRRIGLQRGAREVQQLADSFDSMLDRLESSSETQQRMIEDASHELRTPIAALAVNNEVALSAPEPTLTAYRETIERNQALVERLQLTIDELLAKGRAANRRLQQVDNDLMEVVARVASQHRLLNPRYRS